MPTIHYGVVVLPIEIWMILPYGLVARIPGFHPGGSGSIPGMGSTLGSILDDVNDLF